MHRWCSRFFFFLSLCHMRISVVWGQERPTDRSISKRYLKSDITTWVEKSSTSRAIHVRDTGFYWSSENALHGHFIASSGVGVWMKMLQLIAKRYKNASIRVWIQLNWRHWKQFPPVPIAFVCLPQTFACYFSSLIYSCLYYNHYQIGGPVYIVNWYRILWFWWILCKHLHPESYLAQDNFPEGCA